MPIDYSKYPHNWKTVIVPQVAKRSGNKCETCGVENGATVLSMVVKKWNRHKWVYRRDWLHGTTVKLLKSDKLVKVVLTVAHKNHDAQNHKVLIDDLIHECQACHLRRDAYTKARRRACGKFCAYPQCGIHTCTMFLPF